MMRKTSSVTGKIYQENLTINKKNLSPKIFIIYKRLFKDGTLQ